MGPLHTSSNLFASLLAEAAVEGKALLSRVLKVARQRMRDDITRVRGVQARDHLELSVQLLDSHAAQLCEHFSAALSAVFQRNGTADSRNESLSIHVLRLDQLELMDESQVQERIELARALQRINLKTESSLTELNTYVSSVLGLTHVSHERNPLRPECYVGAFQQLLSERLIPAVTRFDWLQHASGALGEELNTAYLQWSVRLARQGVRAAGFSVVRTPVAAPQAGSSPDAPTEGRQGRVAWDPQYRQTVLTLDRLRRLMAGELDASPPPSADDPKAAFARQFSQTFESGVQVSDSASPESNFQPTVPAAFEALQEMQQIDVVMQRIKAQPVAYRAPALAGTAGLPTRELLRSQTRSMSYSLSLEVVALMVDNLVRDARLLLPVRQIIARLEPALLQLVLIDPRFFMDRQHPARRLLQEISERGLAFRSLEARDFQVFLLSLQRFVSPLESMQVNDAEPFEVALGNLLKVWNVTAVKETVAQQIDSAVAALEYAEERNLLAMSLATLLRGNASMQQVPRDVVEFLCGPWSQVMASAQLKDTTGQEDPGQYKALVNSLLWSAQPELTRKDIGQLTKLVPKILSGLREGLHLIDYPGVKTSAFFDVLMNLHQQAFRPATAQPKRAEPKGLLPSLLGNQDHWVAPAEAQVSGFMSDDDLAPVAASSAPRATTPLEEPPTDGMTEESLAGETTPSWTRKLAVGTWIELQIKGVWQRTQLSWVSPQGTMYLFTDLQAKAHSMTQRMFDRMLAESTLRVVSEQSLVDGALDAVVSAAMRNSLDDMA
jgi:hypothetical protein